LVRQLMDMSKFKLVLAIPSLQAGGMERVMSELANYFVDKEGLEVHLVLYGLKRDVFYKVSDKLIIHKPGFEFDDRKRIRHTLKTLWFLRNKIKKIEPDRILSFGEYWNNFVLLATRGLDYPVFVSDRSQPDKILGRFHNSLRKYLYPKSAGIICQSDRAKQIYVNMFKGAKFTVIGNPIRCIQTNPNIKKENIVLSVGRLIHTKHHDELIKLFVGLNQQDWKLVIVGDDALKQQNMPRLQNLIKSLHAEDRVILAGKQNDVEKYYLKSKIFAFTSSSEGFPNVIGEALSAGLPVVAFDCIAGPSEMIVDGSNGFLVDLFDYQFFGERLKKLMDDEELIVQMGDHGKKSIQSFSTAPIAEKFLNLIFN
jgi:GalNAc-alpha-(1->4)-GalNAc-alpha-(1->3)-diNAcBac-PP-undecaprenol alpha-1,4-N-acetyl-D-galactosaminyltransferase